MCKKLLLVMLLGMSMTTGLTAYTIEDDAPGKPKIVNVYKVDNAGSPFYCYAKFETPDETYGGDEGEGDLFWHLLIDGVEVASGATDWDKSNQKAYFNVAEECGKHRVAMFLSNDAGNSPTHDIGLRYFGYALAEAVTDLTLTEDIPGTVKLAWAPATKDVLGTPLPDGEVTYTITRWDGAAGAGSDVIVAQDLTVCEFTDVINDGTPTHAIYGVQAVTHYPSNQGTPRYTYSGHLAFGEPYTLPFHESFPNGEPSYIWVADVMNNTGTFTFGQPNEYCFAQDNDGGYLQHRYYKTDFTGAIISGKIHIPADCYRPYLELYEGGFPGDSHHYKVEAYADGQWIEIDSREVLGDDNNWDTYSWEHVKVLLPEACFGKDIILRLSMMSNSDIVNFIDNISIYDDVPYNIQDVTISAPSIAPGESEVEISVEYFCKALNAAEGYTVEVYLEDTLVESVPGEKVEPGEKGVVVVHDTMPFSSDEPRFYVAKVVYEADVKPENNVSAPTAIRVVDPLWATVKDLSGSRPDETSVVLTWSAPEATDQPRVPMTEDFEAFECFATDSFGDWTTIDGDKAQAGNMTSLRSGIDFPFQLAPASFFVFDTDYAVEGAYNAASGKKFVGNIFNINGEQQNDMLVSPELCGSAQIVSFKAMTASKAFNAESFEVLASYADNPDDLYDIVGMEAAAPTEWTSYQFYLPVGAKHFAVRCTSEGGYMLLIDDVCFSTANEEPVEISIVGYNVYRDGVKINEEPVNSTEFVDTTDNEVHSYAVSVVYDKGNSILSETMQVEPYEETPDEPEDPEDGLHGISAENFFLNAADGIVTVKGAGSANVTVALPDSRVLYSGKGDASVKVGNGIVVVSVGSKATKIFVR